MTKGPKPLPLDSEDRRATSLLLKKEESLLGASLANTGKILSVSSYTWIVAIHNTLGEAVAAGEQNAAAKKGSATYFQVVGESRCPRLSDPLQAALFLASLPVSPTRH